MTHSRPVSASSTSKPEHSEHQPGFMALAKTLLVGVGLWAALQVGVAIADSAHVVAPGPSMFYMIAPMALAAAVFWGIGRLMARGETDRSRQE